jgi:hypothetical protein
MFPHGRDGNGSPVLNRVAVERHSSFVDLLADFEADANPNWPDLVELTAKSGALRIRLRVSPDELEVLAVALDDASTGGDGELFFREGASRMDDS